MGYDSMSRLINKRYDDGFGLDYSYDALGHLRKVTDSDTKELYQQIAEVNASGQVTLAMQAHGVMTTRQFDPVYGKLLDIRAEGKGKELFNQAYSYDAMRNLISRKDNLSGLAESFQYDNFNRLVESTSSRFGKESFRYRVNGNIHSRVKDGKERLYSYGQACKSAEYRFRHEVCQVQDTGRSGVVYLQYSYKKAVSDRYNPSSQTF